MSDHKLARFYGWNLVDDLGPISRWTYRLCAVMGITILLGVLVAFMLVILVGLSLAAA